METRYKLNVYKLVVPDSLEIRQILYALIIAQIIILQILFLNYVLKFAQIIIMGIKPKINVHFNVLMDILAIKENALLNVLTIFMEIIKLNYVFPNVHQDSIKIQH